jgi:hypothetical protein
MKLHNQNKKGFSKSFLMISLITVAALIGLGIKEYISRKSSLEAHLFSYCTSTSERLGTLLTTPLWNFEIGRLMDIAKVEMKDQHMIHSISINEKIANSTEQLLFCITKDASGQLINCQGNPKGTNIEKTRKLIKNDILIGTLKIHFSQKTIDQQKQTLLKELSVQMFFLIVIVLAGLFMAARSLVK